MALTLGLQNGSSIRGCVWCENENTTWGTITENELKLRTVDRLIEFGKKVEEEEDKGISEAMRRKVRQIYLSTIGQPLLTKIDPERWVPPPVHLLLSLVNTIVFGYVNKLKGEKQSVSV